jgi:hypothetical protein
MKKYPPLASLVTARGCAMEVNAASVAVKAIACSSMEIRRPFDIKDRSDGKASVRYSASGNSFAQILGRLGAVQAKASLAHTGPSTVNGIPGCEFTAASSGAGLSLASVNDWNAPAAPEAA